MKCCDRCKYSCDPAGFEDCSSKGLIFFKPIQKETRMKERACSTIPPIEQIHEEFKDSLENPDVIAVAEGNWGNLDEPKVKSDGSTASYYELPEGATELQDLISFKDMNAQIGEIFRACYRYGQVAHSAKIRDAKKIKFYIEAEIERLETLEKKHKDTQ